MRWKHLGVAVALGAGLAACATTTSPTGRTQYMAYSDSQLNQMGAQVQLFRECLGDAECRFGQRNFKHSAVISGPTPLKAAEITVPDLRGGFSHLIAALAAEGTSTVHGIGIIDRGYEDFRGKLAALGAAVE